MKLIITYVVLLSLQVPFNVTYFLMFFSRDAASWEKFFTIGYLIVAFLYFAVLGVVGIKNILSSFRAYETKDFEYCIKGLMILKYGMLPFFIVNFLSMTALALMLLMASRGTMLFAAPILLVVAMLCTWFVMLPSSFFGLQVIRFCADEGKIGKSIILHILFQFCFLLDVLDTVYLTAFKYKKGQIVAVIVCLVYMLCVLLVWSPLQEFII